MSVDLTKGMKQKAPRQKRSRGTSSRLAKLKTALVRKSKMISEWPVVDIYEVFIDLDPEDLYDNLVNYRLTLDPFSQEKEISALVYITQKLPWPMVKTFLKFMSAKDYQKFSLALSKFIKSKNVKDAIEKAAKLVRKRKATPAGVYVYKTPISGQTASHKSTEAAGTKQCLSTYRHALWASAVIGKPTVVVEIVMRKKVLVPGINGAPAVTNEKWLKSLIRNGWYRIDDSWYETVCRFGRPWREETVGYLLDDGQILEEDKRLYDASVKFFFSSSPDNTGIACVEDYKAAPWTKGISSSEVYKIVAKDTPDTRRYIKNGVKDGWYTLSSAWYRKVCREGRPYIPGGIGYLMENGEIIPETKTVYTLASSYLNTQEMIGRKSGRPEISTLCVNDLLTPTWVKTTLGTTPIRIVALDTPETRNWIVPTPIPGTHWYNLKRSWYVDVCENGRKWLPGVFGYKMASGEIFHETREMFDSYLNQFERKQEISGEDLPGAKIYETTASILSEVLPRNEVDTLLKYLPSSSANELVDSAAKIYVFASKLINKPQIHLERLKRKQYPIKILPYIRKDMMLPEVYKNPALNPATARTGTLTWVDYDELIDRKINSVRKRMLHGADDKVAMRRTVTRYDRPIPLGSHIERCSDDPVYYMEDDKMYCFDRKSLKGVTQNPQTGKNFNKNFIKFVSHIRSPGSGPESMEADGDGEDIVQPDTSAERVEDKPKKRKRTVALAPGLLKSIKKDISSAYSFGERPNKVYCAQCNKTFQDSEFKGDGVNFCTANCFKDFRSKKDGYSFGESRRQRSSEKFSSDRVYCAQCNKTFKDPKFKTIFKGNVVNFCTTSCFEDFRFK